MKLNKEQRTVLSKLSQTIWNSESRWQKLLSTGLLDIFESRDEVEEAVTQVQLNNSKKGRGTIINIQNASGQQKSGVPEVTKVTKTVKRAPSYEELVVSLSDLARATLYSFLRQDQLISALAVDFVGGQDGGVQLTNQDGEQYAVDVNDLKSRLPAELQTRLETLTSGVPVDSLEFLGDVLFSLHHKDQAYQIYSENLDDAQKAKRSSFRQQFAKQRLGL